MTKIFFGSLILLGIQLSLPAPLRAQSNTIKFQNGADEDALVTLVGPSARIVAVPKNRGRTEQGIIPGRYYIMIQYGTAQSGYSYSKGDPFNVNGSVGAYSEISITLNKVTNGNYGTAPINRVEFYRSAFDTAAEALKTNPNDPNFISQVLAFLPGLMPQSGNAVLSAQNRSDLETAEKVARALIANSDQVYSGRRPQGITDEEWARARLTMLNFAQFTLGYIGVTLKDNAKAETELIKTLQLDATNAQASYMLANVLQNEGKDHPEKMSTALFEYARAVSYNGPSALPSQTRNLLDSLLTMAYTNYRGSPEGLEELKAKAMQSALPPADFRVKSASGATK